MTQEEFKSITGLNVTTEEYIKIEKVYMSANSNKKEFCEMWLHTPEPTQDYMMEMARISEVNANVARENFKGLADINEGLLNAMFESVQVMSDPMLRKVCIDNMGKRTYIRKMIEGGHKLLDADKELLLSIL